VRKEPTLEDVFLAVIGRTPVAGEDAAGEGERDRA
jgi:hypothetical protein